MGHIQRQTDVILIGAGVMSATLGSLLKELAPDWKIDVYEQLDTAGAESSNEWNNAGTGHSALCELNYTTETDDGSIDIAKAVKINEQFQWSKQFWSYLIKRGFIQCPKEFIRPLPHISMVQGTENIEFLKRRYEALHEHPLFSGISFTEDVATLEEWLPLIMDGRVSDEPIAATKIDTGTDVNFGALTRMLFTHLENEQVGVHYHHCVRNLEQLSDGTWEVTVHDEKRDVLLKERATFVFIGAGGGSLPLLQKTGIPEAKHVGGFPVSGLFMVCKDQEAIEKHHSKVYGKAEVGAPPMSVPHLDTRFINGEKALLFGPFAGFSPKFLKTGSNLDLFRSVKPYNVLTMLAAGLKEMGLTKYLVSQVLLSHDKRIEALRKFVPNAKAEDWEVITAGQRVQVIKDTEDGGKGTLQFGTEVVTGKDGSVAALLGASPGASTAVSVMLDVLERCFPEHMGDWMPKIKEMIPSFGESLVDHPEMLEAVRREIIDTLQLHTSSSQ